MKAALSPKRILVVPLRFIGDGILTVPLLRALKQSYPDAQVDILVAGHLVNLFQFCPFVDDILVEPKSKGQLHRMIRSRQYDLGFLLRRSMTQAAVLKLAGVKTLVGYDEQRFFPPLNYRRWGWFLDHAVSFPPVDTDIPQVETYLNVLKPLALDVNTFDRSLALWSTPDDERHVQSLFTAYQMDTRKPMAVFHGTSASREKAMTPAQFIPALQYLQQSGYQLIAMGSQADSAFYDQVAAQGHLPLINLCGETTLRESFALMKQVNLLLSLDSAPIHMATAAQVPHIIAIYGPTNERQWRPYPYHGHFTPVFNSQLTCRPCVPKVCGHNRCRTDLSGLMIRQAVQNHLETYPVPVTQLTPQ